MALIDDNYPNGESADGPYSRTKSVTPSDSDYLSHLPVAVEVGATAGTVAMEDRDGNSATFYFAAGQCKKMRPVRVLATGTSLSGGAGQEIYIHH